jgi:DNA polymerase III subunit gamma/tau
LGIIKLSIHLEVKAMYTALYRKWRPKKFEDVYGQEQVTATLKNELENNKISHAYLMCGTRGTGKTSTARLLAKAVNCSSPKDHNPCDICNSCVSINEGSSIDVIEIDAASNRGIDDIRNLREAIKFTPTLGKYKVYIIDEVHMLTNEAFNALLKTLEEPPAYVMFILATTEPHKLPATILSRCQRFDFKRIGIQNIMNHLKSICGYEGMEADEAALRIIARNADGAMRDALSILDQCAVYGGKNIVESTVLEVLGISGDQHLIEMGDAILQGDAPKSILIIDELASGGKEIYQFIKDLIGHYRNLLMTKILDNPEDVIDMSSEGIQTLKNSAAQYDRESIVRCIKYLSELENEAKWYSNPRILLEVTVVRMCKAAGDDSLDGLMMRLAKLEKIISEGGGTIAVTAMKPQQDQSQEKAAPKLSAKKATEKQGVIPSDAVPSDILGKWIGFKQFLKERRKIKLMTFVHTAKPIKLDGNMLWLSFEKEDRYSKEALEMPEICRDIEKEALDYFGSEIKIKCSMVNEEVPKEDKDFDIVKAAIQLAGKDNVEVISEE